jgi:hypothetical protein
MEPVRVVFSVNGAVFTCTRPEQLESFLSSGWTIYNEPAPLKKGAGRKVRKAKTKKEAD